MFNVAEVRKDFPMLNGIKMDNHDLVYLDSGATALKPQVVIDAVTNYYKTYSTNIHRGDYALSHQADSAYENVRDLAQQLLNAKDRREIAYTYGTTHGLNTVAGGLKKHLKKGDVVLLNKEEHASNILPWFYLSKEIGIKIEYIDLVNNQITVEAVQKAIHDKVKIIALAHMTNVLGYEAPLKEITKIAHEKDIIVVVDGAQSVPHMPVDVQDLDVDFLVFSAHKLGGPTGVGVLYGKYELLDDLDPFYLGGGMNNIIDCETNYTLKDAPDKFEAGTPPIEGVIGMGAAIKYLLDLGLDNVHEHVKKLRKHGIERIKNEIEGVILYNEDSTSGPITFNVKNFEGAQAQDIGTALATYGIAVRTGEHCAKLLPDVIKVRGSVRASLYYYNSIDDVDRFVEALKEVVSKGDVLDWLV